MIMEWWRVNIAFWRIYVVGISLGPLHVELIKLNSLISENWGKKGEVEGVNREEGRRASVSERNGRRKNVEKVLVCHYITSSDN